MIHLFLAIRRVFLQFLKNERFRYSCRSCYYYLFVCFHSRLCRERSTLLFIYFLLLLLHVCVLCMHACKWVFANWIFFVLTLKSFQLSIPIAVGQKRVFHITIINLSIYRTFVECYSLGLSENHFIKSNYGKEIEIDWEVKQCV